ISIFFFFQAEDGIRDGHVTGVQTCALPIFTRGSPASWQRYWAARSSSRPSPALGARRRPPRAASPPAGAALPAPEVARPLGPAATPGSAALAPPPPPAALAGATYGPRTARARRAT